MNNCIYSKEKGSDMSNINMRVICGGRERMWLLNKNMTNCQFERFEHFKYLMFRRQKIILFHLWDYVVLTFYVGVVEEKYVGVCVIAYTEKKEHGFNILDLNIVI